MKVIVTCTKAREAQAKKELEAAGFAILPSVSGGAGGGFDRVPSIQLTAIDAGDADQSVLAKLQKQGAIASFRRL